VVSKYNSYNSNKELFDWDANTLNRIKNPVIMSKNENVVKNVHESHVFDKAFSTSPVKKQHNPTNSGSGDIFTWKGFAADQSQSQSQSPKKARKNPNEISVIREEKQKPVKVNKMMMSSEENFLNRTKY